MTTVNPMMTKRPRTTRPARRCTAILAAALGIGLGACTPAGSASDPDSDAAQALAAQFDENLAAAGLPAVDIATATALYGTDGGVSCENVGELQHELSLSQFGNNSGNLRRVVLDPTLVEYDLVVIETYCPDQVDAFQEVIDELKQEETIPTP